ncbi:queuine tRNA-ribosyltransferase tRNA-guanine transglycosylase [Salarchaeum sp. JOR-1]|uniref:queuine tRNA-ribosyltransferase tRNA-guanine transglycosylase n=1 Tax=Salarchaeum sp. JOR-1 TaxID=2599399 RepID=UPI0011984F36|nr:queuine tRNA-ribosyltransferase tRNA-guanine transglycosylase [Salarchaeum sp. JOR-1]QDX41803.1 queuine tRNA-ribosyltransferase tRNA-guanine transglycosylase [Salarchaeum sp. JOR-1]
MRFYVPEWDDAVDANYDFEHDELSTLDRQERELNYIWDIFDRETTPIDGVLISREQVEETKKKAERLAQYGVYDDPVLSVPDWLPTISDCGAWGYKSLPFPPYGNEEMLDFYETLEVSVGVTIDHLVLGSGKDKGRLYLDERAFGDGFEESDIPDALEDVVDLMIDEWPDEWPEYVDEYEPSIQAEDGSSVEPFSSGTFRGDIDAVLTELEHDPRAVYRADDKTFRYNLTLRNAREMYELYQAEDRPFRLMVAIQGWDPESYVEAAEEVLDIGYGYLGIGGVAGSPVHEVRKIVKDVGKTIKAFEREHNRRVDSHVFGFAKSEAFETIGRSGMSSFDSASMLRSAWTGGENYRLNNDKRYDAIRVRYPSNGDDLREAVEKSLRGREVLVSLRAYDAENSIEEEIWNWHRKAEEVLPATRDYLRDQRHDERYNASRLQDIETAFRDDFEYARELQASFSDDLRGRIVKLLREDTAEDPIPFVEYDELLTVAEEEFEKFPRMPAAFNSQEHQNPYDHVWTAVRDYAEWIGDDGLLEEYRDTLRDRPWEKCECPICETNGIEVCIFRGNDRNRRRGFHNTRRFYDEFAAELPKLLVAVEGTAKLSRFESIEEYLRSEHPDFWERVHDLPVAEVGVIDAGGVHESWSGTPSTVSFSPDRVEENLAAQTARYQKLFLLTTGGEASDAISGAVEQSGCELHTFSESEALREGALDACGRNYVAGDDFVPHPPELDVREGLDVLVIDQCSGSKDIPEGAPVFDADETLEFSKEDLLSRDNVPGIAARDLYTGRQQGFVKDAARRLRSQGHDVERYFISAGFGLVTEEELLPPYEVTFSSMNVGEIRERSRLLGIQEDLRKVLHETDYDVVFFTLGSDYYTSIDIDEMVQQVRPDRIGVVFNRELVGDQFENIVSVPARTEDAKNHGTIVVGLKGLYMKNFAQRLENVDMLEPDNIEYLCRHVEDGPTQAAFEKF